LRWDDGAAELFLFWQTSSGAMRQTMLLCQRFPSSYINNDRSSGMGGLGWLAALVVGCWVVRPGWGQCSSTTK